MNHYCRDALSPEQIEALRRLILDGAPVEQTARAFGVSRKTAWRRTREIGLGQRRITPDDKVAEMRRMRAAGVKTKIISHQLGVAMKTVVRYTRDLSKKRRRRTKAEMLAQQEQCS